MKRGTMRWILLALLCAVCASWPPSARAQGMLEEVLSGALVKPEVGVWALYDLEDTASGKTYIMRQAVVGEERVGRKDGYWVEIEIIPQLGYPLVYKMLLTGPASEPKNIHKLLVKQGAQPTREMPVADAPGGRDPSKARRRVLEESTPVKVGPRTVDAQHVELTSADGTTEVWVNETLPPTGLVRLKSDHGELRLRDFGSGGSEAKSVIDSTVPKSDDDVKVEVESGTTPNFARNRDE